MLLVDVQKLSVRVLHFSINCVCIPPSSIGIVCLGFRTFACVYPCTLNSFLSLSFSSSLSYIIFLVVLFLSQKTFFPFIVPFSSALLSFLCTCRCFNSLIIPSLYLFFVLSNYHFLPVDS